MSTRGGSGTTSGSSVGKLDSNYGRKVQTPRLYNQNQNNDFSIKDKINELNQKANNLNMALDVRLKDRKTKEDNLINNILNGDNYRFKSSMFNNGNIYKVEKGKNY